MLTIRKSQARGHARHGWLDTYHTFSFADYHDPDHMGFRHLRVINEDKIEAAQGFGQHGHRDMEILTWMLGGALQHKDSMGNGDVIRPGELQYMSAGTGVLHSEFNASKTEPAHLLQIWILPRTAGEKPRYGQKSFAKELERGGLVTIASPEGADGSIAIRQDVKLLAARAQSDETYAYPIGDKRFGFLQVARGRVHVNGVDLEAGDGVEIDHEPELAIRAAKGSEFLLFDLD
jgi:redox-sensitive bicupin YhaK (pirin superfamily)